MRRWPSLMVIMMLFATTLVGSGLLQAAPASSTNLAHLAVEYSEHPLGIDTQVPQFSWQMQAPAGAHGIAQSAYRIEVRDPDGRIAWDTGKVAGEISVGIEYAGSPVQATTRYDWELTVWDQDNHPVTGSSWFETGLMNPAPDLAAWDGATWIGGGDNDLVFYSHDLAVFKMRFTVQLDQASRSTRAGFVFGANDSRLMDKNKNIYGMATGRNGNYLTLELDISPVDGSRQGLARLNVYRVGYHPDDSPARPLFSIDVPQAIINANNKYEPHDVYLESDFGVVSLYIDGTDAEHRLTNPEATGRRGGGFNLNPVGRGNNYISFPMVADIGFAAGARQQARFSDVRITHYRYPSNTLFAEDLTAPGYHGIFTDRLGDARSGLTIRDGAYLISGGRTGTFVTADPSRNAMPILRTEFQTASKKIQKARLYATARGIYEMYINGQRVGDRYFAPGLTQYNRTQMYQTYDVTDMIRAGGDNAVGAWLGQGWWSGNVTYTGSNWNFFGDRQSLLAKLVITYTDGSRDVITTTPGTWTYYNDGPIRYGSFFQGEVYDATREAAVDGWSTPRYDDSGWQDAVEVPLEGTAYLGPPTRFEGNTETFTYDSLSILGQIGENPGIAVTLKPKSVQEVRPGVFVYDMGQNMVGVPRIDIANGTAGDTLTLRYAEVLYPDLKEYGGNVGMIMLENIRAALAQDQYIMKGGPEVIQPRFTFHGYRYLEITGMDTPLPLNAIRGIVISSVKDLSSHYETSNKLVNRLWENITWSFRGNFLSIPTDCPQRNERMGWGGDINVFSRTATYLGDVGPFLRRHVRALRDLQGADGRFGNIAPIGGGFGGTLWGSAGIVVAWEAYQQFGDQAMLRAHYPAMKKYMAYLDSRIDQDTGILTEGPLGDWLSPEGNKNDNSLLWTAYHMYDLDIVARAAGILNKPEEAAYFRKRYAERKAFFNRTYVDPETHKTLHSGFQSGFGHGGGNASGTNDTAKEDSVTFVDTQASYAVPLALGAFNDANKPYAEQQLANTVRRVNTDDAGVVRPWYSLMVGFIGTASINEALSESGNDEAAYRLLEQDSYPSWLYPVLNGATTIWERLNSYTVEDGFGGNNSMNSFNHYSFGSVGAWMYNYSLGIQRGEEGVAFKHFVLKPSPDPTGVMNWAKGYYDSMYGRIASEWRAENRRLVYRTTVPANTTATLYLPAGSESEVTESGHPASESAGIRFVRMAGGRAEYELGSGSYEFSVPYEPFTGAYR